MKIADMAEIIRKRTGCDPHWAFLAAADINLAEVKESLNERKQTRLNR